MVGIHRRGADGVRAGGDGVGAAATTASADQCAELGVRRHGAHGGARRLGGVRRRTLQRRGGQTQRRRRLRGDLGDHEPPGDAHRARARQRQRGDGDGAGGWFVGGNFTFVGPERRPQIVHILSDGRIDSAWTGRVDGRVMALALGRRHPLRRRRVRARGQRCGRRDARDQTEPRGLRRRRRRPAAGGGRRRRRRGAGARLSGLDALPRR